MSFAFLYCIEICTNRAKVTAKLLAVAPNSMSGFVFLTATCLQEETKMSVSLENALVEAVKSVNLGLPWWHRG